MTNEKQEMREVPKEIFDTMMLRASVELIQKVNLMLDNLNVNQQSESFATKHGITGCTDIGLHSVQLIFETRTAAKNFREALGLTKDYYQ